MDAPWSHYARHQRWHFLAILFLMSTLNYSDRHIISVLLEPIKNEYHVSDTMLGILSGLAFAGLNAFVSLPLARLADSKNRKILISTALAIWSIFTICCGLAQNFVQLLVARAGVGAAESGAIPTAQSLIADYFPPKQRPVAISVFTSAGTVGSLVAFGIGGSIAAHYGWRVALFLVGAPGIVLSAWIWFNLDEPRTMTQGRSIVSSESFGQALRVLGGKKSYVLGVIGFVMTFFLSYGALVFVPSFLVRVLSAPLASVGVSYGSITALAAFAGTLIGGWIANKLGARDPRWLAWIPAIACVISAALYIGAFMSRSYGEFLGFAFCGLLVFAGGIPPVLAAFHLVCGGQRRAVAIAVAYFAATLVGGGAGPIITGALSDVFTQSFGVEGLRLAMVTSMIPVAAAGLVFWKCGYLMMQDTEVS